MNALSKLILLFIVIALFINYMKGGARGVKRWSIYTISGHDIDSQKLAINAPKIDTAITPVSNTMITV